MSRGGPEDSQNFCTLFNWAAVLSLEFRLRLTAMPPKIPRATIVMLLYFNTNSNIRLHSKYIHKNSGK